LRVEALERRDLLAVATPTLMNGVLRVEGDGANDQIEIRQVTTGPIITLAGPGAAPETKTTITVKDLTNNNAWTFDFDKVQQIKVDLKAGHDWLFSDASVATEVLAGEGNDTVETGNANDTLLGGAGHDVLTGNDGDDQIFGEDDNDLLVGG